MGFGFFNGAMLIGLSAMALPLLAHLISRRRFDIVSWGAMQFLQLGRKTRRRIRLEELLLMAMRMGVLGLIAFGMSRPWASGGALSALSGRASRDVVLVVDSSYSMGWKGPINTPHAQAIQWGHKCLDTLRPGDTVSLLDVRDQVRSVIDTPSSDFDYARQSLDELPPPSGSSNLASGVRQAIQILSRSSNASREVIVLTDSQKLPWRPEDIYQWTRIEDSSKRMSVPPRIWVVDLVGEVADRSNVAVGVLELSRQLTVPEFPIRIRSTISQTHPDQKRVVAHLEINGQRVVEKSQAVELPANGEASVEFEHRFVDTGSHLISIVVDEDNLPGDDRADAVVEVADGIPVLVVDGDPRADPTQSDSFFVMSAFSAVRESPWVRAQRISASEMNSESFQGKAVVWLLNVPTLTQPQAEAMIKFAREGGAIVFAAGNQNQAGWYNALPPAISKTLAPAKLIEVQSDVDLKLGAMRLESDSLTAPWLERFQTDQGVDLTSTRFSQWWRMEPVAAESTPQPDPGAPLPAANLTREPAAPPAISGGTVLAKLDNGAPWLITRPLGKGVVAQLAVPLDSDWSTLPSKNDFVPLLHEMVFAYSTQSTTRNVDLGAPLVLNQAALGEMVVRGPDGKETRIATKTEGDRRTARYTQAELPGVYEMRPVVGGGKTERFAVNFDRRESELARLTPPEQEGLVKKGLVFTVDPADIEKGAIDNQAPSEFWWWLLLIVIGLLVFEVVMTRRLVQGGHILIEPPLATPQV